MNANKLPTRLGEEPLLDVVCGVTFQSELPADTVLPGLLLSRLPGQVKIEQLAAAQLPKMIRDTDPNLQNAPLVKMVIDKHFVALVGTKWLAVGCLMPYAGWSSFKKVIIDIFSVLKDVPFVRKVDRYSLKYVDLISEQMLPSSLEVFNLRLDVASRRLSDQVVHLRTEISEGPFVHAVTVATNATVQFTNSPLKRGTIADVDTHRIHEFDVGTFVADLPELLDEIHLANKKFFFELLSEKALAKLDPKYD